MDSTNRYGFVRISLTFALLVFVLPVSVATTTSQKLKSILNTQQAKLTSAVASEKNVDAISDDTRILLDEYKLVLRQVESLTIYNNHLRELVSSQEAKLAGSEQRLKDIEVTNQEIVPLMIRMVDTLDQFVKLDIPFLPAERRRRVEDLKELMRHVDVSVSEKYRRILEAYQIEAEYGRTIEAYRDTLNLNGNRRSVEFLRFGRIALIYQTLDAKAGGIWDSESSSWIELPSKYLASISKGLRIARKQVAPDLLKLPIQAPVNAQ